MRAGDFSQTLRHVGLLALLAVLVLCQCPPLTEAPPGRDSGVFLYVAQRWLEGGLPYISAWDHKPPGVYAMDLGGLWLSGGRLWGVWAVELVSLLVAMVVLRSALLRTFGPRLSLFGAVVLGLGAAAPLEGGNLTEEYALPWQALGLLGHALQLRAGGYALAPAALVGFATGTAFLFKPNMVGIGLAVIGTWLLLGRHEPRRLLPVVGVAGLGAAAPLLATSFYLWWHGAWSAAWDQVIIYNQVYSTTSHFKRLVAALYVVRAHPALVVLVPMLAMVLWRTRTALQHLPWLLVGGLALGLELVLCSLSGRAYMHYYMAWLPALAILSTLTAAGLLNQPDRLRPLWLIILMAALVLPGGVAVAKSLAALAQPPVGSFPVREAAKHVQRHTGPNDSVLVWGAETTINTLAQRRSPTRYVYFYPLIEPRYSRNGHFEDFLEELRRHPPACVVEALGSEHDAWAISGSPRANSLNTEMSRLRTFIRNGYQPHHVIGKWRCLKRI